jgi:hypothetical protein
MVSSSSLTNYETSMTSKSFNGGGSSTILSNGKMNSSHIPTTNINTNGSTFASTTGTKPIFARNSFNTNGSYSKNSSGKSINNSSFTGGPTAARDQFNTSVSSNATDFYFRTLLRYVRSGADESYAEKLEFLLKQCPALPSSSSSSSTKPLSNFNSTQTNPNGISNSISSSGNTNSNIPAFSSSGSPVNTVGVLFLWSIKYREG